MLSSPLRLPSAATLCAAALLRCPPLADKPNLETTLCAAALSSAGQQAESEDDTCACGIATPSKSTQGTVALIVYFVQRSLTVAWVRSVMSTNPCCMLVSQSTLRLGRVM